MRQSVPERRSATLIRGLAACLLALTALVMTACHGEDCNAIKRALKDLAFVGAGAVAPAVVPAHESGSKTLPASFDSHRQYVFHCLRSICAPGSWQGLEESLKRNGVKVTKVPTSAADLVYLVVGGPLFTIKFECDGRTGSIQTTLDPKISASSELAWKWNLEDYILVFDN